MEAHKKFIDVVLDPALEENTPIKTTNAWSKDFFTEAAKDFKFQAFSQSSGKSVVVEQRNPLIGAIHYCYTEHRPLCLSPQIIWLAVLQGFSKHMEINSEKLREKFVDFKGKKELTVIRDNFTFGNPDNDWQGVYEEFVDQIGENIGAKNQENLSAKFSCTNEVEQAVLNLTVMDSMKQFFEFVVLTRCGIPKVRLLGTKADWELLRTKTKGLAQYDLDWWTSLLLPIMDHFVAAFDGANDKIFWNSIFKSYSTHGSGANTYVNGWCINFFPYMHTYKGDVKNPKMRKLADIMTDYKKKEAASAENAMGFGSFPLGITTTDFVWNYLGKKIKMGFVGGFAGVDLEDGFVKPVIGWAVGEKATN